MLLNIGDLDTYMENAEATHNELSCAGPFVSVKSQHIRDPTMTIAGDESDIYGIGHIASNIVSWPLTASRFLNAAQNTINSIDIYSQMPPSPRRYPEDSWNSVSVEAGEWRTPMSCASVDGACKHVLHELSCGDP